MRTYDSRTYEDAYMAGIIAGGMTKTNTLGVVGSIPIPEVMRNINSFTLGAQSVNPKIKTKVVWVNTWFDPPKETEAAQSLINRAPTCCCRTPTPRPCCRPPRRTASSPSAGTAT
jgi:basic membrane protein A and related proteins